MVDGGKESSKSLPVYQRSSIQFIPGTLYGVKINGKDYSVYKGEKKKGNNSIENKVGVIRKLETGGPFSEVVNRVERGHKVGKGQIIDIFLYKFREDEFFFLFCVWILGE